MQILLASTQISNNQSVAFPYNLATDSTVRDFFFPFFLLPPQVLTYIVVHIYIVKYNHTKSHTRYLISSQGILHFTKQ